MRSMARSDEDKGKSLFVVCQFSLLVVFVAVLIIVCWKGIFEPLLRQPTVYFSLGDQSTCERAEDGQGKVIPCAEAIKGSYHTVWIAPKTLR